MDLTTHTPEELRDLLGAIDHELAGRAQQARNRLIEEFTDRAAALGLGLADLIGRPANAKRPAKYRNPGNPAQTWSGMGKRPAWFNEAVSQGTPLEALKIQP